MKDSNIIPKNYKEVEFFYLIKVTKEFENLVRQNSTPKNILFPIFNQLSPKFQNSSKNFNEFLRFLYQTHFPANRPRKRHIRITYVAHKSEFVFLLLLLFIWCSEFRVNFLSILMVCETIFRLAARPAFSIESEYNYGCWMRN